MGKVGERTRRDGRCGTWSSGGSRSPTGDAQRRDESGRRGELQGVFTKHFLQGCETMNCLCQKIGRRDDGEYRETTLPPTPVTPWCNYWLERMAR